MGHGLKALVLVALGLFAINAGAVTYIYHEISPSDPVGPVGGEQFRATGRIEINDAYLGSGITTSGLNYLRTPDDIAVNLLPYFGIDYFEMSFDPVRAGVVLKKFVCSDNTDSRLTSYCLAAGLDPSDSVFGCCILNSFFSPLQAFQLTFSGNMMLGAFQTLGTVSSELSVYSGSVGPLWHTRISCCGDISNVSGFVGMWRRVPEPGTLALLSLGLLGLGFTARRRLH